MVLAIKRLIQRSIEQIMAEARKNPETGIGTTSDPRKEILQVIAIAAPFLGAQWQSVLAVATFGFLALRLRDRVIRPATGHPAEAASDCLFLGGVILVTQIFFLNVHSVFGVDYPPILSRGLGISLPLVWAVRTFFHLNTLTNDPQKEPEFRLFRATARINIMWWVSGAFAAGSCAQAVPGSHTRDQILGLLYVVPAQILLRLIMDPDHIDWIFLDLHSDPAIQELQGRKDRLIRWTPVKKVQFPHAALYVAIVGVLSILSTTCIAFYRLFTGAGANVNWMQILVSDAGLCVLGLMLLVIMHVNERTAEMLDLAIQQKKMMNSRKNSDRFRGGYLSL